MSPEILHAIGRLIRKQSPPKKDFVTNLTESLEHRGWQRMTLEDLIEEVGFDPRDLFREPKSPERKS